MQFPFLSLRILLIPLVLLAMAPALVLALYTNREQRPHEVAEEQTRALHLVQQISLDYEGIIDSTRALLFSVAQIPSVRRPDVPACNKLLSQTIYRQPHYVNLGLSAPDGQVVCSARLDEPTIPPGIRAILQRAVETRDFAAGSQTVSTTTDPFVLYLAYPVLDPDGLVQNAVFAVVDLDWMKQAAVNAQMPAGATLTLTDQKGTILFRYPDAERRVGQSETEPFFFQALNNQDGPSATEATGTDGIVRLYSFARLQTVPNENWLYLSVSTPGQVTSAADQALRRNIRLLGLVAALMLGITWAFSEFYILRRCKPLMHAIQRLQAGDLSARTGLQYGSDELGRLALTFDEMAASLQQRNLQLVNSEANLRASEFQFRSLFENSPLGIAIIHQGIILSVNQTYLYLFGYEHNSDVCGEPLLNHIAPGYRQEMMERMEKRERGEVVANAFEAFGSRKGGSLFSIYVQITRIPLADKIATILFVTDMTERRQSEHALQESEEKYRILFELAYDAFLTVFPDGTIRDANLAAANLLGYPIEELRRLPIGQIVAPELRSEMMQHWHAQVASQGHLLLETIWIRKDGSRFPVAVTGKLLVIWEQSQFQLIARDITHHRQTEQQLKLDQLRFETLYELSQMMDEPQQAIAGFAVEAGVKVTGSKVGYIGLAAKDEATLTLEVCSKEAIRECGISAPQNLRHAAENGLWAQAVRERKPIITNDYEASNSLKHEYPQGHIPLKRQLCIPLVDRGQVVLVAGVANKETEYTEADVRELTLVMDGMWRLLQKKSAEEALQESERKIREIIENSEDGIVLTDERGIVIEWNRGQERIAALPRDRALGRLLWDIQFQLMPEEDRTKAMYEELKMAMLLALAGGPGAPPMHFQEVPLCLPNGVRRTIQIFGFPIQTGKGRRLGAITRDITELKSLESAKLRHTKRLEVLHEIDQAILTTKSPDAIAQAALDHLLELAPCQHATIVLFDWERQEGQVIAANTSAGAPFGRGARIPLSRFGNIEELERGKIRIIDDTFDSTDLSPNLFALDPKLHSYITVPLLYGNELIAALDLAAQKPGSFTLEFVDIAAEVANSLAIALQNARLLHEITAQGQQLRGLAAQLADAQEGERKLLSQELHDRVGQYLTALGLDLNMIRELLPAQPSTLLKERLDDSEALVAETVRRIRNVMAELRPPDLDDYGLVAALRWYGEEFAKRTGLMVTCIGEEFAPRLPAAAETGLFRIAQEALTNIAKHAHATKVVIMIEKTKIETATLIISDDGVGFDLTSPRRPGWGLVTMRERAEAVGAHLKIESLPAKGTRVVVEVKR